MKNILIDVHPSSTKLGIVENGELIEFWVERKNLNKLVGNIYKGKVVNVLPGMQAAFVNIGLERNGFLFAGDTLVDDNNMHELNSQQVLKLKEGDTVLCQVLKDEFGTKGARLTMNVSIPGHLLVMMPLIDYIGISRKIEDEPTRERLTQLIETARPENFGYVIRTEAEHASDEEIVAEIEVLRQKWNKLKQDYLEKPCFSLLFDEEDLITRAMRDMLRSDIDKVIINDPAAYQTIQAGYSFLLKKPGQLELYARKQNLFSYYGINAQVGKLLKRKVVLKNGAYLYIDRTEALTVIDVNTGKYVGDRNLEETVFNTNKLAAREIAKQLRLRNIGGIVIIDFIDMALEEHREEVLAVFQEELAKDTVKTNVMGMTALGLVELTRKKTRSMIESIMLQPCPYCNGDAYIKSDENMIMLIRDALMQVFQEADPPAVKLHVHPQIFSKLFSLRFLEKECAEDWADKRIYVIPDEKLHLEKYVIEQERKAVIELPDTAKLLY